MSQPSGFVPVKFKIMGKIILSVGILGFVLFGLSLLTGWFGMPPVSVLMSFVSTLVGLYLIFVVPSE